MSIVPPIPVIQHFQNFTLKTQGQGQMAMMLHNYRSRQFHRTSNGINPSNGFRDVGSDPYPAWFDKLLAHGQAIWGKWANNYDVSQLQVTVHETLIGVNPSSGFRDMCSVKSGPNWWANDPDSAQLQA